HSGRCRKRCGKRLPATHAHFRGLAVRAARRGASVNELIGLIAELARRNKVELEPSWAQALESHAIEPGADALAAVCGALGWKRPERLRQLPRAQHFPLLVYHSERGWGIAEQWRNDTLVRVRTAAGFDEWPVQEPEAEVS